MQTMTEKKQTHQQILEKAIQKAANESWKVPSWILVELKYNNYDFVVDERVWPTIIFNHDFAKALWGEEPCEFDPNMIITSAPPMEWIFHLQRMVVAEDPIKYLGENI